MGHLVLKIARGVLIGVVLVVAVGVALLTVVVPGVTGSTSLTVLSGSMTPTIPVGAVVLVKPTDPATILAGDVITFQKAPGNPTLVTHRVVEIVADEGELAFVTKGDANPAVDIDPVPAGAVRGRVVFHAPYVGRLADAVRTPAGLMTLVIVPCLIYIGLQIRSLRAERRKRLEALATGSAVNTELGAAAVLGGDSVTRELLLAQIWADTVGRVELVRQISVFGGTIAEIVDDYLVVAIVSSPAMLDQFESQIAPWPMRSVRRSGLVTLPLSSPEIQEASLSRSSAEAEAAEAVGRPGAACAEPGSPVLSGGLLEQLAGSASNHRVESDSNVQTEVSPIDA